MGETPTVYLAPVRGQVNDIATISAQGTVRFKLYTGRFTATVFLAAATRSKDELKQRLSRYLHQFQKLPQRIISYFQDETIAYAAL
jgi:hypothetical protein